MIFGGTFEKEKIMTKSFFFLCLFFVTFLLHSPFVLSEQIVIDSEDQYRFAQAALDKGEYLRAITEFERFVQFFPRDDRVPEARYRIGLCYIMAKDPDSGRRVLEDVYVDYSSTSTGGKALFLIGESYYEEGLIDEAGEYFEKVVETYPNLELRNKALYRLGWNWMKQDKWGEASETFMRVKEGSPLYPHSRDLSKMSLKGEELSYKNPTTAGILSGILPGLGHAYCNRYKDGTVALLLNGLTIWASLEAFDKDMDVLGGALMFLELGWYSGTMYGAVNSAHKYNRKVRNDFRRKLPEMMDLGLFSTRDGSMGVALKIGF